MPKKLELTGRRFGKLLVQGEADRDRHGAVRWLCRCECGETSIVKGASLAAGVTKSCGCGVIEAAAREKTTHGDSATPLYARWQAMLNRCRSGHLNYGGRGIVVCSRWLSFEAFSADMGSSFSEDLELDRISVNGNYEPDNCRWATRVEQQRNKRTNHRVTISGRTMSLVEWEEETGVKANTILTRIRRGWPESRWLAELANALGDS